MKINAVVFSIALLLTVQAVRGQDMPTRWHNVRGIVVDKIGRPAPAAIVYIKDVRGHRLRMKQTDSGGRFSFGLVNIDNNYEIYAEQASVISQKVPIRTVQSRHDIVFKLVLTSKAAKN